MVKQKAECDLGPFAVVSFDSKKAFKLMNYLFHNGKP